MDVGGDGGMDVRGNLKGWMGALGRWVGMVVWSVRAKDQVEGMKGEVFARIVEINMLLSLKRQSEVSEADVGLVASPIQVVQRPIEHIVDLGPSPAYHADSVTSTNSCEDTTNDNISSSHHHAPPTTNTVEDRPEPSELSDLPSYTQAIADGAAPPRPPRPLPEPVGPPAYLTEDSERWEKYMSPSSSISQTTRYSTAHDLSTNNGRFVEGYHDGGQYESQGDQRPLPLLVLAPLRRNETDDIDTFSEELTQAPEPDGSAISSSSVTSSQSHHENTSSYGTSSTTLIGTATSFISSFLATVSGKDSGPMDEESQLPRPSVDPHLTLEDVNSYPPSARYYPSTYNTTDHNIPTSSFSSSSWTESQHSESVRTGGSDSTVAWPGGRPPVAYWEPNDEYDDVEVPPSVYVWMGKGKEEVW